MPKQDENLNINIKKNYKKKKQSIKNPLSINTNIKNSNAFSFEKKTVNKKTKTKRKFKISFKTLKRLRKVMRNKPVLYPFGFETKNRLIRLQQLKSQKKHFKRINIRITSNNVFCTLVDVLRNKTLVLGSSGKYSVKTSKKTLKFSSRVILESFFEEIKRKLKGQQIIISIVSPRKLRKKIFWFFVNKLRKEIKLIRKCIFNVEAKKPFNGCKVAKQKRKKRKGLRIFK
jgi:ribosomal protein S11